MFRKSGKMYHSLLYGVGRLLVKRLLLQGAELDSGIGNGIRRAKFPTIPYKGKNEFVRRAALDKLNTLRAQHARQWGKLFWTVSEYDTNPVRKHRTASLNGTDSEYVWDVLTATLYGFLRLICTVHDSASLLTNNRLPITNNRVSTLSCFLL